MLFNLRWRLFGLFFLVQTFLLKVLKDDFQKIKPSKAVDFPVTRSGMIVIVNNLD